MSKGKGGGDRSKKSTVDRITELAQPLADELGLFLWDVRFEKEGATWYLRVLIDKDGGVDINDCEKFHRAIDPLLDEADPIEESYTLEVSSPGIERELKYEWHYECCVGDTVEVKLYKPYNNAKNYVGKLLPLDDNLNLECGGQKVSIPREYVAKVNIYFDIKSIDQEDKRKK